MLFILGIIFLIIVLFYYAIIKPSKYWEEKDVVHAKSWPLVGSMKDFFLRKKHFADITIDIYNQFPNERCVGLMQLTRPFLMIRDIDLIKKITVKDFDHFHDHLGLENAKSDPLFSKSLLSLSGESWQRMRATLSPVFTSSKMRTMYTLMTECAHNLVKHFEGKKQINIEMKEVASKFANDVIATTAFGVNVDSFKNPDNEFYKMGNKFTKVALLTTIKAFIMQLAPKLANFLRLQLFSDQLTMFFRSLILDNMKIRETQEIVRPDLIHLLMEARKGRLKHEDKEKEDHKNFASVEESHIGKSSTQMELTDDDILAQALIFFFAGFDTVSTGSSFMAHELALHPEIQEILQEEMDEVSSKYNGDVPYEALLSIKYLDQVVCETLRKWPPGFQTDRLCVKDYVIEPKNPKEKVVFVPKGTSVMLPIIALHRDPKYFENPNKFDPDRFSDENKKNIIPGTYLPFGIGPRNCIGSRFALLEIKILFFHLLSRFNIIPVEETAIPLKVSPKNITFAPENGFQLGLTPRF